MRTCVPKHMYRCLQGPEEGIRSPGVGVMVVVGILFEFWEANSGSLEEQHILLSIEPSLQTPFSLLHHPRLTSKLSIFGNIYEKCTYNACVSQWKAKSSPQTWNKFEQLNTFSGADLYVFGSSQILQRLGQPGTWSVLWMVMFIIIQTPRFFLPQKFWSA